MKIVNPTSFSDIPLELSDDSLTILREANAKRKIRPRDYDILFPERDLFYVSKIFDQLEENGFIKESMTGPSIAIGNTGLYSITPKGISYLQELKQRERQKQKTKKKDIFTEARAWVTLFIAILSFTVAAVNSVQTNYTKNIEVLAFSNVFEDDYYFDGQELSKEISFIVSNNSQIGISLIALQIIRGGENVNVVFKDTSYTLPIDISSCSSFKQSVYFIKELSQDEIAMISDEFGVGCRINSFELDTFLEEGANIHKGTIISVRPSLQIKLETSKGTVFTCESLGGASA
ncbi:MAG: hypothetical protein FWH55_14780 [Oscillospiraceae bacterium]|nr:hypothetical protein [Oscillospiraceae bacterium]